GSVEGSLRTLATVARLTDRSPAAFVREARALPDRQRTTVFALLARKGTTFSVLAAVGPRLTRGERVTVARRGALARAFGGGLVSTGVIRAGGQRLLGFALGPPIAPAGTVVYEEQVLAPAGSTPPSGP